MTPFKEQFAGWSVQGEKHRRLEQPSQDALSVSQTRWHDRPLTLLAVADGHGSPQHPLSATGAALATLSLQSAFYPLALELGAFHLTEEEQFRLLVEQLHRLWREQVLRFFKERDSKNPQWNQLIDPLPELEREQAILNLYGTTLRLAVITPETIRLATMGDGATLLLVGDHSRAYHTEWHKPDATTRSLCGSLADWQFQQLPRVQPEQPLILALMSDGVSDGYSEEEVAQWLREAVQIVQVSKDWGRLIESKLAERSRAKSQDDATLALWWSGGGAE